MQSVPGVVDLQLEQQMDVPQFRIRADRTALAPGIQKGTLFKAYASALMRRTTRSRWYRQSRRRRQVPHRRLSPTSLHFGPSAAARILNASFEIMFCGVPPQSLRPGLPSTVGTGDDSRERHGPPRPAQAAGRPRGLHADWRDECRFAHRAAGARCPSARAGAGGATTGDSAPSDGGYTHRRLRRMSLARRRGVSVPVCGVGP